MSARLGLHKLAGLSEQTTDVFFIENRRFNRVLPVTRFECQKGDRMFQTQFQTHCYKQLLAVNTVSTVINQKPLYTLYILVWFGKLLCARMRLCVCVLD